MYCMGANDRAQLGAGTAVVESFSVVPLALASLQMVPSVTILNSKLTYYSGGVHSLFTVSSSIDIAATSMRMVATTVNPSDTRFGTLRPLLLDSSQCLSRHILQVGHHTCMHSAHCPAVE